MSRQTRQKIVVDSSVMVKWLNIQGEDLVEKSRKLWDEENEGKTELVAPELAKYEVENALLSKKMGASETKEAIRTYYEIPVTYITLEEESAVRAWEIAAEFKITIYDAVFVTLAEKLGATLVTNNPKHQKGFGKVKAVALKDY